MRKKILLGERKNMSFAMNTAITTTNSWNLNLHYNNQALQCKSSTKIYVKPLNCTPLQQQVDCGVVCECCSGIGWLLCDLCKGQKINVKTDTNRIYRRCPACKAIGRVLCSKCKVYRCVTFPDQNDGVELKL